MIFLGRHRGLPLHTEAIPERERVFARIFSPSEAIPERYSSSQAGVCLGATRLAKTVWARSAHIPGCELPGLH